MAYGFLIDSKLLNFNSLTLIKLRSKDNILIILKPLKQNINNSVLLFTFKLIKFNSLIAFSLLHRALDLLIS